MLIFPSVPTHKQNPFILQFPDRTLDCRPKQPGNVPIMGILNVTPDSFFDGGLYITESAALEQTERMLREGASIIDIGGESTRPGGRTYGKGAEAVAESQERTRVIPIIQAIAQRFPEALISIDTYKPAIAKEALEAGAHIINDVTGLRLYPEMAEVAASFQAPLVLMHSIGRPGDMPHVHHYDDVTSKVYDGLSQSIATARAAGVQSLIVDPGFGFGKTPAENLKLIGDSETFLDLGYPLLVGISRKSTIGIMLGEADAPAPVDQRLFGTLGATAVAVMRGASIVRTHDVKPTVEMLELLNKAAFGG